MFAVQAKNGFVEGELWTICGWRLSEMANGMERSRILSIAASVRAMIAEGKASPHYSGRFFTITI